MDRKKYEKMIGVIAITQNFTEKAQRHTKKFMIV